MINGRFVFRLQAAGGLECQRLRMSDQAVLDALTEALAATEGHVSSKHVVKRLGMSSDVVCRSLASLIAEGKVKGKPIKTAGAAEPIGYTNLDVT